MTSGLIQGTPTPLPLLVTSIMVTNVWVYKTLPSFHNSDGRTMNLNVSQTQRQTFFCLGQATLDVLITFIYKLDFNWKIFLWNDLKLRKFQSKTLDIEVEKCWLMLFYPHPPSYHVIIFIFFEMVFWNWPLPTFCTHVTKYTVFF